MGHPKGAPKTPGSGRKPMFTDPEEMRAKIDAYFERCKGYIWKDDKGQAVLDKFGRPIILDAEPPTVTGLALALGFTNRNALLTYQGKKEFKDLITEAKSRVEAYCEGRLFDRDGANGARFSLQCNFKWADEQKKDGEGATPTVKIICDIPRPENGGPSGATPSGALSGAAGQSGVSDDASS